MELAKLGLPSTIVSVEPQTACPEMVGSIQSRLGKLRIDWIRVSALPGPGPFSSATSLTAAIGRILREKWSSELLLWARSFAAAAASLQLSRLKGWSFVYDTRGYWVQNRARRSPQWLRPLYGELQRVDRRCIESCCAAVFLTELGVEDATAGRLGRWDVGKKAICIPTCTDFDSFGLSRDSSAGLKIGFVGAINDDYLIRETLYLARRVLELRQDAELVCVTHQRTEMKECLRGMGISAERTQIVSATHDQMPRVLRGLDFGFLLLRTHPAKRASMPTKFAEFLASGVAPVQFGCNEELSAWAERTGSSVIVKSIDLDGLETAAQEVVRGPPSFEALSHARTRALEHFDLKKGAEKYASLFRSLLQ